MGTRPTLYWKEMRRWVVLSISCILLQDFEGNLKPEDEWPSEIYWKSRYPHLFPNSLPESAHEQEQVSHHSTILWKFIY